MVEGQKNKKKNNLIITFDHAFLSVDFASCCSLSASENFFTFYEQKLHELKLVTISLKKKYNHTRETACEKVYSIAHVHANVKTRNETMYIKKPITRQEWAASIKIEHLRGIRGDICLRMV